MGVSMDDQKPARRPNFVGGRHGSPNITIAFPFSQVKTIESDVRDAVAELAALVAELAPADREDLAQAASDIERRFR
jgi:hypothetical protein